MNEPAKNANDYALEAVLIVNGVQPGALLTGAMELSALQTALSSVVSKADACVIAAWIGGAREHSQFGLAEVESGTQEQQCGLSPHGNALNPFQRLLVSDALDNLKAQSEWLHWLIVSKGSAWQVKQTANLKRNQKEGEAKVWKDAGDVAKGLGIGTTAVVVLVALAVLAVKLSSK